ncbi:MAG: hypothetical protein ACRDPW_08860, partial [Mycobacteriales bacterium]
AAVSALLYESRGADAAPVPVPAGPLSIALASTGTLWSELNAAESERGLTLTKQPDIGFVRPMLRWARGESLQRALRANSEGSWRIEASGAQLSAGDFVRWARQVLDLLEQIAATAAPTSSLRTTARQAVVSVRRGVLASPVPADIKNDDSAQ